ncbi:MAG TPA: hypothetical protein DCR94_03240 [Firmicutes bacterium]|nr:hypothetical protein [Bacillota bacterium]
MLNPRDRNILLGVIRHSERMLSKMKDVSYLNFECDEDLKEIVCFNLLQVGELSKHLSKEFISSFSQMPWRQIKGMRDHVAHGYETLDLELIYNTAKEEIPELERYCRNILVQNKEF